MHAPEENILHSRPFAFGTKDSAFVPKEILDALWQDSVENPGKPTFHPFYGHFQVSKTCWHWKGPGGIDGVGRLHERLVSWLAWYTANGPVPDGYRFENTCGNPLCFNPAHMTLVKDPACEDFLKMNREFSDTRYPLPWDSSAKFVAEFHDSLEAPPPEKVDAGCCRNGHDLNVVGFYFYNQGSKKECRGCREERQRRRARKA